MISLQGKHIPKKNNGNVKSDFKDVIAVKNLQFSEEEMKKLTSEDALFNSKDLLITQNYSQF